MISVTKSTIEALNELQKLSVGFEASPTRSQLEIMKSKFAEVEKLVNNLEPSQTAEQAIGTALFKTAFFEMKRLLEQYDETMKNSGK